MASLLNVNTIQTAAGGTFNQYRRTPLQDWALHTNNTLSTGVWYAYGVDLFVTVNPSGSYGSHCYYLFQIVATNQGNSGITNSYYLNFQNYNYSPFATWTTSTYLVPAGWSWKVVNDYGSVPVIRTYTV